ncbi:uncharacterized protein MYCFIDRAFT_200376 [Pseudocercospora fijiensis CIRAD86]|uniref:Uncharacterized protein n=1 Tax=Pseudocercospora fijiensis (strain CIRAD86) TaxID=383855 RepID=M3A0U0_PSEFD|nr:uncharacterized protein MYCFIDRAFT_200376 [Pseudocercospora fijiensis CIRAD86]EME78026.1 hypothetical protein MYCFIDRAFT_200376 [Pseudocercospora fijiensis CIRAD86]
MAPNLMSIPRELRDQIWEQVYGTPTQVRLTCHAIEDSYKQGESKRYPEQPVAEYPPVEDDSAAAPSQSNDVDSEADSDAGAGDDKSQSEGDGDGDGDENEDEETAKEDEPIDFDVYEFLKEHPESDDESYDVDSEDDSDEEEVSKGYKIFATSPVDTSLLMVSHQVSEEAAPYFWASLTLIFEYTAIGTMRFLMALPAPALDNIRSIGLTSWIFMDDDKDSFHAWNGSIDTPLYHRPDGPTLITPFASFLASHLPNLEEIYLYTPTGGDEDFYCLPASLDLHEMLDSRSVKRLHHVFLGDPAAKILSRWTSKDALEILMGRIPALVGYHWYRLLYPEPEKPRGFIHPADDAWEGSLNQAHSEWFEDSYDFKKNVKEDLASRWSWSGRDIDFGGDGNVQAVITVHAKKEEGQDPLHDSPEILKAIFRSSKVKSPNVGINHNDHSMLRSQDLYSQRTTDERDNPGQAQHTLMFDGEAIRAILV